MLRQEVPADNTGHQTWDVQFHSLLTGLREANEGDDGPYREFYSLVAQELQEMGESTLAGGDGAGGGGGEGKAGGGGAGGGGGLKARLPLLVECPRNGHKKNEEDKKTWFVPCHPPPLGTSLSEQLSMFRVLGVMVGCAMRSKVVLDLDMPPFFWKQLAGDGRVDLDDVRQFKAVALIDQLDDVAYKFEDTAAGKKQFENDAMMNTLGEAPSPDVGYDLPVRFEDRLAYREAAKQHHLREGAMQIAAVRSGIASIIPAQVRMAFAFIRCGVWGVRRCGGKGCGAVG